MKKLAKMQMPKKRKEMEVSEESMAMEMEPSESESEDEMELAGEQEQELEGDSLDMEASQNPELDKMSDDELLAEIKKRGLMSQLESDPDSKEQDQSQENYF